MANVLEGTAAWTVEVITEEISFESLEMFLKAEVGSEWVSARTGGGQHTLGVGEMDHIAVLLEHVNLLDGLDGLDIELLERSLQFLVVGAG